MKCDGMECEKRWEANTHYGKKNSPNEGQIVRGKGTGLYLSIVDLCLKQRGELKYCDRLPISTHEKEEEDSLPMIVTLSFIKNELSYRLTVHRFGMSNYDF